MLTVQLDQNFVEKCFQEELKKRLDQVERGRTLWDMKELCRQTSLSENTIKEKFFFEEGFPKYKVGGKWLFPAKECEAFLLNWIREQPNG